MFRSKIDKKDLKEFSKISFLARGNDEKYYFHIKSRGASFTVGQDILKNSKLEKIGKNMF